ncbi:hypothetical protein BDP55DRAFT_148036 [Colletotrichum godetiae]|uniref:Uncharacterized protein n=1 Tax=Colletotrichum godetiae TaxID=1209918 RepID=A0AAJ0AKS4_9PEZI|nr:uncharacterized protein BDP55DRAFT_148036 [Colletotrichum godetiae]KAK1675709.1 hypothetical protein BDP55DRAFT_148036 [Colletotrichum godetiae]
MVPAKRIAGGTRLCSVCLSVCLCLSAALVSCISSLHLSLIFEAHLHCLNNTISHWINHSLGAPPPTQPQVSGSSQRKSLGQVRKKTPGYTTAFGVGHHHHLELSDSQSPYQPAPIRIPSAGQEVRTFYIRSCGLVFPPTSTPASYLRSQGRPTTLTSVVRCTQSEISFPFPVVNRPGLSTSQQERASVKGLIYHYSFRGRKATAGQVSARLRTHSIRTQEQHVPFSSLHTRISYCVLPDYRVVVELLDTPQRCSYIESGCLQCTFDHNGFP